MKTTLTRSLVTVSLLSACSAIPDMPLPTGNAQTQFQAEGLIFDDPPPGWGSLSQIASTYEDLLDVQGNRDGLWENENDAPGTVRGFGTTLPLKPWLDKNSAFLKGRHLKTHLAALNTFLDQQKQKWQQPISRLQDTAFKNRALFEAQKAIVLTRMQRTPAEVTEGFVVARGSVKGQTISPREVFWQRFKPIGQPNGKVVLVSPGFQESGRNFVEQIQLMNQLGYDAVVMDHQWGGYTRGGQAGGLDRGFGVSRDVAAMAAFVQQEILQRDYASHPQKELILFGNSMGAGPGVLAALTLNDQSQIQLAGTPMPKKLNAVLQAPFLDASPTIINRVLGLFSKFPFANTLQLFSSGIPTLTHDKVAAQKGNQVILMEDMRAQLQTMSAANSDIQTVHAMIQAGQGPLGQLHIIHGNQDPLADPAQSKWLQTRLGEQVHLQLIASPNHVLEQHPQEQKYAVQALGPLGKR